MANLDQAPPFFVPQVQPGAQEELFAELAGLAGVPVPALAERIYETTFLADDGNEVWTARVGAKLSGHSVRRQGEREYRTPISDPATVLAIFPWQETTQVVTDSLPPRISAKFSLQKTPRSRFSNPFFGGDLSAVRGFAPRA